MNELPPLSSSVLRHLTGRRWLVRCLLAVLMGATVSCQKENSGDSTPVESQKKAIVTTTTMITDLVRVVAGDSVEVVPLLEAGIDPHTYVAKPSDIAKLRRADAVIYNGLHLEGRMIETIETLRRSGKKILALGDSLPEAQLIRTGGEADPHIWGDPRLWAKAAPLVAKFLFEIVPSRKETFEHNASRYQSQLLETHEWMKSKVRDIPADRRVLVTSHDAFRYFGQAVGFEVVSVQGISTDSEASSAEVTRIIDLVKRRKIPTIFVESSTSPDTILRIAKDAGCNPGPELLSDALGQPGEMDETLDGQQVDRGTVLGMYRSNLSRIVRGLMQ